MKFKDWFDKKLVVGGFPYTVNIHYNAFDFDYVINVSDEYYTEHHTPLIAANCKYFWFPMNECKKDIGLNSIYGALYILWVAEKQNKNVYLHCHAGVNRSKSVQAAYYYLRTGEHFDSETKYGYINKLVAMCGRGYLPPKAEMEKFLTVCAKKFEVTKYMGGMLDSIKLDSINNF